MSMWTRAATVFLLLMALAITARALPPLPKYVEEHYQASPEYARFVEKFKSLDMEHQCDACHKPGVDRKVKGHGLNDFGQTVARNFKHRDFNKADKLGKENAEEAAKAKQLIAEALRKAEAEKNAAGKTYGELLKAGQMPGTN
jgi:hypothetical protein